MKKKWTPHIIAVGTLVVFIVLGLACASSPDSGSSVSTKLFEIEKTTVNLPDVGKVDYEKVYVFKDEYGFKYSFDRMSIKGKEGFFGYSIGVDAIGTNWMKGVQNEIAGASRTPGAEKFLNDEYNDFPGPFILVIDGEKYSIDDYRYEKTGRIVFSKSASLVESIRETILNCSKLIIDDKEITPEGITAIKKFIGS